MENPDIAAERARNRIIFEDDLDRHVPQEGNLRFVERFTELEGRASRTIRILQRHEFSQELGTFDWFDVRLATEEGVDNG